ncbi:MAG: hypothetical protein JXA03_16065 [Bacteroidales bacterium]|nr:hypothetical protein [Bacteroidales bacterium]
METIALNIQNKEVKEKIIRFLNDFVQSDIEITSIEDLKDLLILEEAKKDNEENIPLESVLKEYGIEDRNK